MAFHAGDHIARLNADFGGGTIRLHVLQDHAVSGSKCAEDNGVAALLLRESHANGSASDFPVLDELVVNDNSRIRGQGETYTLIPSAAGDDGGVDTDDVACHIDQRAARIARIDGRVRLQKMLELAPAVG